MPSFDVVSKVDWAEFGNALLQAQKEIGQRFDFRNTETSLEKNDEGIVILANAVDRAKAAIVVFEEKLVKRKVSLKHLDKQAGNNPRTVVMVGAAADTLAVTRFIPVPVPFVTVAGEPRFRDGRRHAQRRRARAARGGAERAGSG